ncbi:transposase [Streptomyces sp. BPTC-684]|uniref:transposase n=1 Tax=Streptomyces sp. BPTC-684 TaxID=3043734 RepID=UPI0024B10E76|nr:transposase [Streptomyces sp. BPTC-684]WHM41021.1 transposase [Streptomyces sp. BPTC-684]
MYAFFRRWRDHGLVKEFRNRLRGQVRGQLGRAAEPSAAVIDSQSVKADAVAASDSRGFDGGELVNGRKRHVVVDTLGLLLAVVVTAADTGDRASAQVLLRHVADTHHRLELVWADGGYTGSLIEHCLAALALVLLIVKRSDGQKGFVVHVASRDPAARRKLPVFDQVDRDSGRFGLGRRRALVMAVPVWRGRSTRVSYRGRRRKAGAVAARYARCAEAGDV